MHGRARDRAARGLRALVVRGAGLAPRPAPTRPRTRTSCGPAATPSGGTAWCPGSPRSTPTRSRSATGRRSPPTRTSSGDLVIGADCTVNVSTVVRGTVRLGDAVRIGGQTSLLGFDHGMADLTEPIFRQPMSSLGITVGDDVWIGSHVVVLDGVRIGSHAVVGAGSVVTRDVPEWAVVVGNPARVVRDRRTVGDEARRSCAASPTRPAPMPRTCSRGTGTARRWTDRPGGAPTVRAHCDAIEIADLLLGSAARAAGPATSTWPGCTAGRRRRTGPRARARRPRSPDLPLPGPRRRHRRLPPALRRLRARPARIHLAGPDRTRRHARARRRRPRAGGPRLPARRLVRRPPRRRAGHRADVGAAGRPSGPGRASSTRCWAGSWSTATRHRPVGCREGRRRPAAARERLLPDGPRHVRAARRRPARHRGDDRRDPAPRRRPPHVRPGPRDRVRRPRRAAPAVVADPARPAPPVARDPAGSRARTPSGSSRRWVPGRGFAFDTRPGQRPHPAGHGDVAGHPLVRGRPARRRPTPSATGRAACTGRRRPSRSGRPLQEPSHVGGLTGVLEAVADDAHQPDAERHRRVPAARRRPGRGRSSVSPAR